MNSVPRPAQPKRGSSQDSTSHGRHPSYPPPSYPVKVPPGGPTPYNRASYPNFLSFFESLKLQCIWGWCGLVDAFRWNLIWRVVAGDAEVRANVIKSSMLNGLSLVSIYAFDYMLLPILEENVEKDWVIIAAAAYGLFWMLPIFAMSIYLNHSWCDRVAHRTMVIYYGRRQPGGSAGYNGMVAAIANSAYRFIFIVISFSLSFLLSYIPHAGGPLALIFLCWINAYYCFEFIWIERGYSFSQRVKYFEERWAYHFAFGLPSASLCLWTDSLISMVLFALFYPAYIILAVHAHPMPIHPYNPTAPASARITSVTGIGATPQTAATPSTTATTSQKSSSSGGTPTTSGRPGHVRQKSTIADTNYPLASPFLPIRIPIFGLVILINNLVVKIVSVSTMGRRRASVTGTLPRQPQWNNTFATALVAERQGADKGGPVTRSVPNGNVDVTNGVAAAAAVVKTEVWVKETALEEGADMDMDAGWSPVAFSPRPEDPQFVPTNTHGGAVEPIAPALPNKKVASSPPSTAASRQAPSHAGSLATPSIPPPPKKKRTKMD